MTNKVPQFPGKPPQTGEQQKPAPACPELSAAATVRLGSPVKNLVAIAGRQDEPAPLGAVAPVPCIGDACALHMRTRMADGTEFAGCARVMQVFETNRLNLMMGRFLAAVEQAQDPAAPATAPTEPSPSPSPAAPTPAAGG